jgi:SAF domain-containing protein
MTSTTTARPTAAPIAVARTAPRRRSIMQGALAVLLIVAGALTAGYVVLRMGTTHDYLAVATPVGAGAEIRASDLIVVRVNEAVGLRPVPAGKLRSVVGLHAKMALVPGTLLAMDQLTDTPIPAPGFQLIGMSLKEGKLPSSRLTVGAAVLLVVIPDRNATSVGGEQTPSDLIPPRTIVATVVDIKQSTQQGETLINVQVATADAPTVATLSAADRIVISLTGN